MEAASALFATPSWPFFAAAILALLVPIGLVRALLLIVAPLAAAFVVFGTPLGIAGVVQLKSSEIILQYSSLTTRSFGFIVIFAALLCGVFAWSMRDRVQQVAMLVLAGCSLGAVFVGDFVSFIVFWEGAALAGVFLIWQRRGEATFRAGTRFIIWHLLSGIAVVAGAAGLYAATGSTSFTSGEQAGDTSAQFGVWALLLGLGIRAAFPLLGGWLKDGLSAGTVTGALPITIIFPLVAMHALTRIYAEAEYLLAIGAIMVVLPLVFAMIENDARRVIAHLLTVQLGVSVVGIGGSSTQILAGQHALTTVLGTGLLIMAASAVLYRTGTSRLSELGGLYSTMPLAAWAGIFGTATLGAMPLLLGHASYLSLHAAGSIAGNGLIGPIITTAIVGSLLCGIRLIYEIFFSADCGRRPAEAPAPMLVAMGLAAVTSLGFGVMQGGPGIIFAPGHAAFHLLLVVATLLAFALLLRFGLWPQAKPGTILDSDWVYRRLLPAIFGFAVRFVSTIGEEISRGLANTRSAGFSLLERIYGSEGRAAQLQPTGMMVLWLALLLGAALALNLLELR